MHLKSSIWGPHFWFFLHTISLKYPLFPNKITKKKYYDLIMNLPLFIPDEEIGNKFCKLLDEYPIIPYLDSRESFVKWVHFIHNIINKQLNKPILKYEDFFNDYYENYKEELISQNQNQNQNQNHNQNKRYINFTKYKKYSKYYVYVIILLIIIIIILYLHRQ